MNEQDANNVSDRRPTGKPNRSPEAGINTTRPQGGAAKDSAASRPPMPEPPRFPRVTPSPSGKKDSPAPSPAKGSPAPSPANRASAAKNTASVSPYDLGGGGWPAKDNPWGTPSSPGNKASQHSSSSPTAPAPGAAAGSATPQPPRTAPEPPAPEPKLGFFGRKRAKKAKKQAQASAQMPAQPGKPESTIPEHKGAKKDTAPAGAGQAATKPNVGQPPASKPASSKPNIGQPPTGKPAAGLGGTKGPAAPPAAGKTTAGKKPGGTPPTGKDGGTTNPKAGPTASKAGTGGKDGGKAAFVTTPRAKAPDKRAAGAPAASATPAGVATAVKPEPAPENKADKKAANKAEKKAAKQAEKQQPGTTEEGEARKIFGFTIPDEAQRGRIARILLPLVILIGGFLFFYFHEKPTPLPELAPVGTELPMETDFDGELKGDRTIRPYDSRLKRGIVPVWQFPGTMLGTTSDGQVLATAHDNMISGWSLHTGKELWTLPSTNAPAWDNWNQPSARGMLPIDGNLVNLATGEQFPIPGLENAQYCSGTANPYIFLIGSDLVGVNPAGQQIFRSPVDSRVGTASTCHGYGAVVRVMPQSATAEAATHNALTGEVMELRGLTGAPGVVDAHFAEDGYIVVRPYVKDRNNWHAYNYQSERLFGNEMPRPGKMPLMFAGNSSGSIEPYRWAMKNELHRGYLIADGGELFAAGDANGDDPVDALQSVREEKGLVLRQSLPQNDPSHTLLVTEDHSTVIVSPHDSDPLNVNSEVEQEHYVAAYDVSSGEELWNYQIGEAEQLNLSQGILWASDPSGSVTVFSPAERP